MNRESSLGQYLIVVCGATAAFGLGSVLLAFVGAATAAPVNAGYCWGTAATSSAALTAGLAAAWILRAIKRQLGRTTVDLLVGTEQLTGAAGQIATASQSVAQGSSEQAASLEETSASTKELSSLTRRNAENTRSVADMMQQTSRVVEDGNRALGQMVVAMAEINASSEKISKIIKVIDEIAFQTNILALNAAVEAARAGDAGMGFAVVADEVRNLAQRSAQAAKDTAQLIEESIARSADGSAKLEQVKRAIAGITENSQNVKGLVDEVTAGSQEQARSIEQIAKAVAQMEAVTQRSAASAEQSASAGEELHAQTAALAEALRSLESLAGVQRRRQPPKTSPARPVTAPAAPKKNDRARFPLDEDFKEF